MFHNFSTKEKRYVLELINSLAQIDGTFTDEEGCILAAVAYLMEINLDVWSPNLVDLSLSYSRVGEMGKNKIKEILVLLMQVSIFDGVVKPEELSLLLPLAYEAGITDEEMLDLGRRAFSGESLTYFDKLLVYALCVKMMEIDKAISDSEKKTLAKIQEKFDLPDNFIDRHLVNHIDWALDIMSAYSAKKRYKIIKYVTDVRDSDGTISNNEAYLLIKILKRLGYKDFEDLDDEEIIFTDTALGIYHNLQTSNDSTWQDWLDFVKSIYYESYEEKLNEYLIDALIKVFEKGLTLEIDKYEYFEAKRILAFLYLQEKQFSLLNKILKEIQKLEVIPKWYWSLTSQLDFYQLSHGIEIKNEGLLKIVKEYTKYGDLKAVNLLHLYPNFLKKYKDYHIVQNKEYLDKQKIEKIVGLVALNPKTNKAISNETVKKYGGRILILGANSNGSKEWLYDTARNNKFYGDIEFGPNYKEIKHIGIEQYKNSSKYHCIFVAQIPHSAKGKGKMSSIIRQLNTDDYPPTITLKTKSKKLYLTTTSFKNALDEAKKYLIALK